MLTEKESNNMIYGIRHKSVKEYAEKFGIEHQTIKNIDRRYKEGDTLLVPNFAYISKDGARGCAEKVHELLLFGVNVIATDHHISASNAICEALHIVADMEDTMREKWDKDYQKWLMGIRSGGSYEGIFDVYGTWHEKGKPEEYETIEATPLERKVQWQEESIPSQWIDKKIIEGWSAPLIIQELRFLNKLMPTIFVSYTGSPISANYINTRKKQLVG